jgi:hypothetical protein
VKRRIMRIEIDDKGSRGGIGYTITVHSEGETGTLAERLSALQNELRGTGYHLNRSRIYEIQSDGTVVITGPVLERDGRVCTVAG